MGSCRAGAVFVALTVVWGCSGDPSDLAPDDEDAQVTSRPGLAGDGGMTPGATDSGAPGTTGRDAGDASTGVGDAAPRDASPTADAAPSNTGRDRDAASAADAARADAAAVDAAGVDSGRASDAGSADARLPTECDWSEPPSDVAMWINESWNAQLGPNIKTRKAWLLDNIMLNKGQLNLCVRWGATTAVPEMVRANLEPTIERWFNDWIKGLGNYGCFPYAEGIKVKVTGWAVRPGKQALLAGVDPSVPVYTETDAEGEPKCPDACSSFVHWDHKFPGCSGGDANHSDYWLWFDDQLPGGGGAAAVGGDWGLRMPVGTFVGAFGNKSSNICEHEMGHGFGFQDYYDWTGSRPKGGSIMIVGSSSSQSPTTGDLWLLRRTWKEMKALRGW